MGKVDSLLGWMLLKINIIPKKSSNKVFRHRISYKEVRRANVYPPWSGARGSKDNMVKILNCTETEKYNHFWAERCWKYILFQKNFQIKVFRHWILYKKVHEGICLSSTQSGARGLERYGWNIKLYRNGKIHSLLGWIRPKIRIIPKKSSNKWDHCSSHYNCLIWMLENTSFWHGE